MYLEDCKILQNMKIAPNIYLMTVEKREDIEIRAGQFFMLQSREHFLRRPISIHNVEKDSMQFYYEVKGSGTKELSILNKDNIINIQGPLGNEFNLVENKNVLVVGGGMGIAPCLELVKRLKNNDITFIAGGRSSEQLNILENFKNLDKINLYLTTDDGSMGDKGRVDTKMIELLQNKKFDKIYTCGPELMMKVVTNIAKEHNISIDVSLEARMACGVGACVGCSIMTKNGMRKVCHDGPIFDGYDIFRGENE